jgi:diguanylate cyclase (GGDEF)-like protein/PAS domain S-box-containing protein
MPVATIDAPVSPVKVLLVEDTEIDAELASRALRRAGIDHVSRRVDSEPDLLEALAAFRPDVILSDYSMPHLDGPRALAIAREHARDVPFIFVSGTIGEEVAIDSLKRGATDYIIKSNMTRLAAAVARALQDSRERASKARAQDDLREAQERFALFMQHLPGPAFIKDLQGRHRFVNAAFERMADMDRDSLVGRTDRELWPELAEPYVSNDRWVIEHNDVLQTFESRPQGDGTHSYLVHKFPIPDPTGRTALIGGVAVDFTARLLAEEKLARLGRIHAFMSGINSAIVRTQARGELLQEACRIALEDGGFGVAWILLHDESGTPQLAACAGADPSVIARRLAPGTARSREAEVAEGVGATGRPVVIDPAERVAHLPRAMSGAGDRHVVAGMPIRLEGRVAGVLALYASESRVFDADEMKLLGELAGDISFALEYLSKKERLDYFAYFDPLTGLPNRALCTDRINQLAQSHGLGEVKAAVLIVDLERFSLVNDSLGRQAGDELLQLVARRLHEMVSPAGTAARVGADAFAVVFTDVREGADVARLLEERVAAGMGRPFAVGGQDLRIAFKCGVALFPDDGRDAESLLCNAEMALKNAKDSPDRYLFYAAPMNARVAEILNLENALRAALAESQFVLHYQPKIDVAAGLVYGLEALVRWNSPERGLVPPAVFLPIVEQTGMILELGMWVMRQAALDQARLFAPAHSDLRVSVNVSSLQLRQKHFVADALEAIRGAGGNPASLDLEITETVIMEDIEQNIPKLDALRALGMGVEIDDFGTGYSSLAYLGKLPMTALKIDRTFVTAMSRSAGDRTIISTIISLAHLLGLSVVAEGVETVAQRDMLRNLGCTRMQGYLFSRPLPAGELLVTLARGSLDVAGAGAAAPPGPRQRFSRERAG